MDDLMDRMRQDPNWAEYRRLKTHINLLEALTARMIKAGKSPEQIYAARKGLDRDHERLIHLESVMIYRARHA